jgi:hypothetical protein
LNWSKDLLKIGETLGADMVVWDRDLYTVPPSSCVRSRH